MMLLMFTESSAVLWLCDEQHEAIFTVVFFFLHSAADVCCVSRGVPQSGRAGCVSMYSRLPQEVSSNEEAPSWRQPVVVLQIRLERTRPTESA